MDQTDKDHLRRDWPGWMRILPGLGAIGVIVTGVCIAIVPGFEVRHATMPKSAHGMALSGTTAIVVRVGVVIWGLLFLAYVLSSASPMWWKPFGKKSSSLNDNQELTDVRVETDQAEER